MARRSMTMLTNAARHHENAQSHRMWPTLELRKMVAAHAPETFADIVTNNLVCKL